MGDMSNASTGQISRDAAALYEEFFVPALFAQWPERLLGLAGTRPGDAVLDIACGTGVLARAAAAVVGPAGAVCGVDLNSGMLEVAARIAPEITWLRGAAEDLPVPDQSADRVCSQFGLMFVADRATAVREMARVMRPGGRACVATWAALSETPGYAAMVALLRDLVGSEPAEALSAPFTIGTPESLQAAMAAGFSEVEVHRLDGEARFASLDAWVTTEVRAWTLQEMLDDTQLEELRVQAGQRLRKFCDDSGAVRFPAPALVAVARA